MSPLWPHSSCANARPSSRAPRSRAAAAQGGSGCGTAVAEELVAALGLVVFADGAGGPAQHVQRAQEAPVRLVLPGNRPRAVAARTPQLIQPPVIPGPRVRVRHARITAAA